MSSIEHNNKYKYTPFPLINHYIAPFKCSILTSIMKVAIIQPFDLLKFRIHSSGDLNNKLRLRKVIRTLLNKEGIQVFLKGVNVTSFSVFFSSLVQFTLYQTYLNYFINKNANTNSYKHTFTCSFSGLLCGISMGLLLTPVDTVRIKLQAIQNFERNGNYKYSNSIECVRGVYKSSGIKGFYIALPMAIAREGIACSIYFGSFEYLKNRNIMKNKLNNNQNVTSNKTSKNNTISKKMRFLYGSFAGGINWMITLPIDIIKTKIVSDRLNKIKQFKGPLDCIEQIYNSSGLRGFYKGFSVVFIRL